MLVVPLKPPGLEVCKHMCVCSSRLYNQAATVYSYHYQFSAVATTATTAITTTSSLSITSTTNTETNMIYVL